MKKNKKLAFLVIVIILVAGISSASYAADTTGLPWETPLEIILASISGPVAKIIGALAIIGTGLGLAFGEGGGLLKKGLMIVFGLSIAFTASSFFLNFFGFSAGVLFR